MNWWPFRKRDPHRPLTPRQVIWPYVEGAGCAGVPGAVLPHSDLLALGPLWTRMIIALAAHHNVTLDEKDSNKIALALTTSLGLFVSGVGMATWYFSFTGFGLLLTIPANVGTNAAVTYAAGMATSKVFQSDGGDPDDMAAKIVENVLKIMPKKPR